MCFVKYSPYRKIFYTTILDLSEIYTLRNASTFHAMNIFLRRVQFEFQYYPPPIRTTHVHNAHLRAIL
jgi:hypothetical protein